MVESGAGTCFVTSYADAMDVSARKHKQAPLGIVKMTHLLNERGFLAKNRGMPRGFVALDGAQHILPPTVDLPPARSAFRKVFERMADMQNVIRAEASEDPDTVVAILSSTRAQHVPIPETQSEK